MSATGLSRSAMAGQGSMARRHRQAQFFKFVCAATVFIAVALLAILLVQITRQGLSWVDWQFVSSFPSRFVEKAGIRAGLIGSIWIIGLTILLAVPLGVATAVYLEEYARAGRLSRFIELNIANLAGVPSIVYGMLGLTLFVRWLSLDRSVLAGALTLTLMSLPVIIIASREAIRAVPMSLRHAAFALGASRWQTVRHHVLPSATPGILTGVILAMSRAMGETAPLILVGALSYVAFVPESPLDEFTVLPIQIFNWASRPQAEFHELAAGAIVVLLAVLLGLNAVAAFIRHRTQRTTSW